MRLMRCSLIGRSNGPISEVRRSGAAQPCDLQTWRSLLPPLAPLPSPPPPAAASEHKYAMEEQQRAAPAEAMPDTVYIGDTEEKLTAAQAAAAAAQEDAQAFEARAARLLRVTAGAGGAADAPEGAAGVDRDTLARLKLLSATINITQRGDADAGPEAGAAVAAAAAAAGITDADATDGAGPLVLQDGRLVRARTRGMERYFVYDGEWRDCAMSGLGVFLFADGGTCVGQWRKNHQSGHAIARYPDGTSYVGKWANGKFNGFGTAAFPCRVRYEGAWREGLPHGHGVMRYPSGLVYEGNFVRGRRHGHGRMRSELTGYEFTGDWFEDMIEGYGALANPRERLSVTAYWSRMTFYQAVRTIRVEEKEALVLRVASERQQTAVRDQLRIDEYVAKLRQRLEEEAKLKEEEEFNARVDFYKNMQRRKKEAQEAAMSMLKTMASTKTLQRIPSMAPTVSK